MKSGWREKLSSKKKEWKENTKAFIHHHSHSIKDKRTNHQEIEGDEKINNPLDIATKVNEEDEIAQLKLKEVYCHPIMVGINCDLDFKYIVRFAEQGDMEAQFRLGDLYALGHCALKNSSNAYQWYTKSAIQGYKKALIRIYNLYQEDIKMHCRGQINSDEKEWVSDDFKKKNGIRELNEYRLEQNKNILNGAVDYYTKQFKHYQASNQEDPVVQLNLAFLYHHGYGVKKCNKWAFDYYTMAAEKGNTDAQFNLGNLYQKHTDMKLNYRHAFKWYTKSAQGGNVAAQRSLAYFYLKGIATDINCDTACSWYTKAANTGDSQAQVILAKLYRKGDYIKQDLSMAVKWYTLAARQGNIVAQNCLSQLHQRSMLNNIELDEDMLEYVTESSMNSRLCTKLPMDVSKLGDVSKFKQLNKLIRRALMGDGHAMYEFGLKYLKGDKDFVQDEETGLKWIKNAANAKNKEAQSMIADIYKKGGSVEQDYHKATIWYKALTKQKDADAQCNVGIMYNEGLGVREDPLEASKWFFWAANQKNSDAQYSLAKLRFDGRGLGLDEKEAMRWLFESAHQKNIQACHDLGSFYFHDKHGLKNVRKTGWKLMEFAANTGSIKAQLKIASWYKRGDVIENDKRTHIEYLNTAANAQSAEIQYQLALLYLERDNINQDYIKAYNLFKQAKDQGYEYAKWLFQTPIKCHHEIENYTKITEMFIEETQNGVDDLHYHIGTIYEHGIQLNEVQSFGENYTKAKEWYSLASDKGDSRADCCLGVMFEEGKGVGQNSKIAIDHYEKAYKKGNGNATYRLACMYRDGHSNTPDSLKAFHYFTMASTMGHQEANKALVISEESDESILYKYLSKTKVSMLEKATEEGYIQLQYQIGVWYEHRNEYPKAFTWLTRAAEIGVTDAYYRLGVLYEEGKGTKQDYIMAAEMYQKAAEKKHEDACYRLGLLHQYENGVKRDYSKAYRFYKQTADMGHAKAHKILNITLETKINFNGDIKEAFFNPSSQEYQYSLSMCEQVAVHGNTEVQFKVGFAYEYCVLEQSYVEAHKWYSMAAQKSHKEAIYHLGLLYEKGFGIPQNYKTANEYYEQASQLGNNDALYRLGNAYHHGNGVKINIKKAIEYYTRSAKLGKSEYRCELGRLYEEGELVQKNLLEALKWYTKAYLQGYDNISSKLYDMYEYEPYEEFFFKRLFDNLSIASRGDFRLNKNYEYNVYFDLNNRLGIFCALGNGTNKNMEAAWEYFTKKYDNAPGPFKITDILSLEHGFSIHEKYDMLKALADKPLLNQTAAEPLYELGLLFFDGIEKRHVDYLYNNDNNKDNPSQHIVIEKDNSRAFKCFEGAASMSHSKAMFQLGIMYHCGHFVDKDHEKGDEYFSDVASKDIKLAGRIATLYHVLEGVQNFPMALKWYKHLEKMLNEDFENGVRNRIDEQVQLGLGLLYEYGNGVEKNYEKALTCYKRIANTTSLIGILRLALMYYYGKGVEINYEESFNLFRKATETNGSESDILFVYIQEKLNEDTPHNNLIYCTMSSQKIMGESLYYLGLSYYYGQGVSQNNTESQINFYLADVYGCNRAKYEIVNQ